MKHWPRGDAKKLKDEALRHGAEAAESSLLAETDAGESLNTFQQFGFELWSAGLAKAPYSSFLVSWSELAQGPGHPRTSLAAMCVHLPAEKETGKDGIGVFVMAFASRTRTGFSADRLIFYSQLVPMWFGDERVRIRAADNTPTGTESGRSAIRAVAAVIGALGAPKACRTVEPAPDRLNHQRLLKGREPIRSQIVIDLRPEKNLADLKKTTGGGWTVKPPWRLGHIRTLADGRQVPVPPRCMNMEEGLPVKSEYILKSV